MEVKTEKREWSFLEYRLVTVLFTVNLICAMVYSLQAPIYPHEVLEKNGTATEVALVLGSYEIVMVIATPLVGAWLAFFGLRTTFNVGVVVVTAGVVLFGFVNQIPELNLFLGVSITLRIVQAIGAAGVSVATFTMVSMQFPSSHGFVIGILETAFGAGNSIGPFIGSALYQTFGFTTAFVSYGCLHLLAGILANFVLFRKLEDKKPCQDKETTSTLHLLKMLCTQTQFLHALWVFIASCNISFLTALLAIRLDELEETPISIGGTFLVFGAVNAVSSILVGYLGDKLARSEVVVFVAGNILLAGYIIVGPFPFAPIETSVWITTIGVIVIAVGAAGPMILPMKLAVREIREVNNVNDIEALSSFIVSTWIAIVASGGLIGPLVAGALYDYTDFRIATLFPFNLNILLLASYFFYALLRLKARKKEEFPIIQSVAPNLSSYNTMLDRRIHNIASDMQEESCSMTEDTATKKWTLREYKIVSTLFGVNLICAMVYSLQAPIYPQEVFNKNGSATHVGLVLGSYEIVLVVASPVVGAWLTFCGLRTTFNVGIIVSTAGVVLFGFVNYIQDLNLFVGISIALRVIQSIGAAGIAVSTFTMVSMGFPASQGFVIGLLETAFGAGNSVGPFAGSALYQLSGFTTAFVSFGALQLFAGMGANFLLFEKSDDQNSVQETKPTVSTWNLLKALCTRTQILHAFWVFIGSCNQSFVTALLATRLDGFDVTPISIGTVFLVFGGVNALSSIAVGYLGDKLVRAELIVLFTGTILIAGCVLLGPLPYLPLIASLWMTILAVILIAVGFAGLIVIPMRLAVREIREGYGESNKEALSSFVVSMWIAIVSFGGFIGPLVAGAIYDQAGFRIATLFPLTIDIFVIASFGFYSVFRMRSGKKEGFQNPLTFHSTLNSTQDLDNSDKTETLKQQ